MGLVSLSDVGTAARATLVAHLPGHLARLVRPLPVPSSYDVVPTADNIRRVKGAACAVSADRLRDEPTRRGDGTYDARFVLTVALFHQNGTTMPVVTATGDYAAGIRECLVQNGSLGGFAQSTTWIGESADLVGDERSSETLGLAVVEFTVHVRGVLDSAPPAVLPATSVLSTVPAVSVRTRS